MPTVYSKMVDEALMLDKLSEEDIKRTLESLSLSEKGEPAEGITKEDFNASNLSVLGSGPGTKFFLTRDRSLSDF